MTKLQQFLGATIIFANFSGLSIAHADLSAKADVRNACVQDAIAKTGVQVRSLKISLEQDIPIMKRYGVCMKMADGEVCDCSGTEAYMPYHLYLDNSCGLPSEMFGNCK